MWWVYAAIAVTGVSVMSYAIVQQDYRESLNDPQIQMAEDAAAQILAGTSPSLVVPTGKVDITNSLAPWLAVYNGNGDIIASNGVLDGSAPTLPQGVFNTSSWQSLVVGHHFNGSPVDQNRFTWQPTPSVRQAVVLVYIPAPQGPLYVAAGRNMREVEQRIEHEGEIVFVLWAFTLGCLLVASFVGWSVLKAR